MRTSDIYSPEEAPIPDEVLEARKNWVAVLRSGRYRQVQGHLMSRSGKSRCCLGVAADPEVISGLEFKRSGNGMGVWSAYSTGGYTEGNFLTPAMKKALGFSLSNPSVMTLAAEVFTLAALNDSGDYDFDQIADAIERTYITPYEEAS